MSLFSSLDLSKLTIEELREQIVGRDVVLDGPFGPRNILYADYTATGRSIESVDMVSDSDGWAVADQGQIHHYDGVSWTEHTDTGNEKWNTVFMVSASDGWVAGDGGSFAQYNGTSWTESNAPSNKNINGIHVLNSNFGFAVADSGDIHEYNGSSWVATSSPTNLTLNDVFVLSTTNAWIAADNGVVLHFDGNSWTEQQDVGTENLDGIAMISPTLGWTVGNNGSMFSWNGSVWSDEVDSGTEKLNDIVMIDAENGWAVGEGGKLMVLGLFSQDTGTFESEIIDSGKTGSDWSTVYWSESFPVGGDVTIATRTGDTATPDGTWSGWSAELTSELGSSIVSGDSRYLQYRATLDRPGAVTSTSRLADLTVVYDQPTSQHLWDISLFSSSSIWAVGSGGVFVEYDGTSWTATTSPATSAVVSGVDMVSASDVWAVTQAGEMVHYDGSAFTMHTDTGNEKWNSVDMITTSDGWAVGDGGAIAYYNGTTWDDTITSPTGVVLNRVVAIATDDVWAVGNSGEILHYNGSSWSIHTDLAANSALYGISYVSSTNIHAVGTSGKFNEYNGTSWSEILDTGVETWTSVVLVASDDGWAAGDGGELARWNGSSWSSDVQSPTSRHISRFAMVDATLGWAVGNNGTMLKFERDAQYKTAGIFTSSAFDMGDASPTYVIEWDETIPTCTPACTVKLQVSTAPDDGGSPGTFTDWYGASGAGTYYTAASGTLLSTDLNHRQWIRYRATFAGDGIETPVLTEVRLNYR